MLKVKVLREKARFMVTTKEENVLRKVDLGGDVNKKRERERIEQTKINTPPTNLQSKQVKNTFASKHSSIYIISKEEISTLFRVAALFNNVYKIIILSMQVTKYCWVLMRIEEKKKKKKKIPFTNLNMELVALNNLALAS